MHLLWVLCWYCGYSVGPVGIQSHSPRDELDRVQYAHGGDCRAEHLPLGAEVSGECRDPPAGMLWAGEIVPAKRSAAQSSDRPPPPAHSAEGMGSGALAARAALATVVAPW